VELRWQPIIFYEELEESRICFEGTEPEKIVNTHNVTMLRALEGHTQTLSEYVEVAIPEK